MATTPIPQAASKATVASPRAQLGSLAELATRHVNEQLLPMVNRLVAALLDVSDPALDAPTVYHRVKSGNLLKTNSYAYLHLAGAELERGLRKEVELLAPQRKKAAAAKAEALTLVPMEVMDRSVAFAGISRPFEAACAEQLATLNVRLGFLLERDTLRIGQNPFRPEVILMALSQAWIEFEPDADAHGLLAPMLRPAVVFDFAPLYEALNEALAGKDGQAGSADALRIRKTNNAARAKAERATGQAALAQQLRQFLSGADNPGAAFDADIPLIPDLPAMPQGSGGWRPSGAESFRAAAPAPSAGHGSAQPAGERPPGQHARRQDQSLRRLSRRTEPWRRAGRHAISRFQRPAARRPRQRRPARAAGQDPARFAGTAGRQPRRSVRIAKRVLPAAPEGKHAQGQPDARRRKHHRPAVADIRDRIRR